MADRTNFLRPSWQAGAALAVLAGLLVFVAWDGMTRSRQTLQLTDSYGVTIDAPEVDASSATGYAAGRRSMLVPGSATDTHHWIMHTQTMLADGAWRIRHVDYDNAPEGREMHWASPFRWWLGALAWIDHVLSERPIGVSVERAALLSGPVMFGVVVIGLMIFVRRTSSWSVVVLVIGSMVAVQPFYLEFVVGRADHHGIANLCGMFTVWLLLLGSGTAVERDTAGRPESAAARRWFVGSALAGGTGLWISAATQVPVLIGVGLGVLGAGWLARGRAAHIAWLIDPDLFRLWGRVGAAVSLGAHLIEYFPGHLGMRLEVNHPFYALAWLGAGEVLRVFARAMRDGWLAIGRRDRMLGALAVGAITVLPVAIAVGGEAMFLISDSFLWRLSTRHVAEAQGLLRLLETRETLAGWLALTMPMAWLLLPVLVTWRGGLPREWHALVVLAWVPAGLGWMLGWGQIRWLGLAWAMTVPLLAVCYFVLRLRFGARPQLVAAWSMAAAVLFVPGMVHGVRQTLASAETSAEEIRQLAERDVAHWLRLRVGGEPAVIAAAPGATTWLAAYGGLRGLGTLYWENTAGLKKIAELYAAPSPDVARALVRRWGVTHIVGVSWNAFETALVKEARGLPVDAPVPADAFIMRLLSAPIPEPWLRAVPFSLPPHAALAGAQVRIWEVVDEQTPADAAAHAANFFLELGLTEQVKRMVPVLSRFGDDLNAAVMLAAIASSQRDTGAFLSALEHVSARLAQADALALDDHVHLVVVLAVAQRVELARTHLRSCLRKATAATVRELTPGSLADLLALSDALQVAFPDPQLQRLAQSLVPPSRRN